MSHPKILRILLLLVVVLVAAGAPSQQSAWAQDPSLTVPEGFIVEHVAGPPLVERPIMASFDDEGRLYVSDSAGVNHRGPDLLKDPPHVIRLLEDTDGDGRFDSSHVFADKLVFPQGLLWHDGAVFTTSPPSLLRLEDTDGDGVCDKRTELVTGFALTGVADDAHGACLGPDGRIYFLPGRMKHQIALPGGKLLRKAMGPWVMRCLPDGREVEFVSGSQGNPVEVAFSPGGDMFVSGTFWAPPSFGGGLRDALIHCVEGGEYPVRDRTYKDRTRTGDLLPVLVPMVATAPSGIMLYRSGQFGAGYEGNLFCTYFNTHKVMRHILERDGATFRSRNEDFLMSNHPDFHPTDVLEDADGSLLVLDTGGWFRIGCPTSKIAKPRVRGAIYRIRRQGAHEMKDPRGLKLRWDSDLVRLLDDPRFVVRDRAVRELAKKGAALLLPALQHPSPRVRRNTVWTLSRIDGEEARAMTRRALLDKDVEVRQVATYAAGLHGDVGTVKKLMELVRTDEPQVRREAASALGRIGRVEAVPAILDAVRHGGDRFLEHALTYALIRIADPEALVPAGLRDPSPAVRRASLIALDQMRAGNLTPDLVTPLLDPTDLAVQRAAFGVIMARPMWAKEIFSLVRVWLADKKLDAARQDILRGVIVAFCRNAMLQDLVARALRNEGTPTATRLLILESMAQVAADQPPSTWLAEARWCLDHPDERVVRQAVATLRALGATDFDDTLVALSREEGRTPELRAEALAAATARLPRLDSRDFKFLLVCLDQDRPPLLRLTAAEALGEALLDLQQLETLCRLLRSVGPLELPRLAPAFERTGRPHVGKKLVAALARAPALESLSPEALRNVLKHYPSDVQRQAEPLLKRLEVDTGKQQTRLVELKAVLSGGNAAHGRRVFFGKKAACATCHTVQSNGAPLGPDLTKIGAIRSEDDLLEALVFPSASFARGYETYLIGTGDGRVHDGMIARETADAIHLFTAQRTEKRIPRSSVEVIRESRVSIMPQGMDTQLSHEELRNLIAFLKSLK